MSESVDGQQNTAGEKEELGSEDISLHSLGGDLLADVEKVYMETSLCMNLLGRLSPVICQFYTATEKERHSWKIGPCSSNPQFQIIFTKRWFNMKMNNSIK